jgi:hypothetical protein
LPNAQWRVLNKGHRSSIVELPKLAQGKKDPV